MYGIHPGADSGLRLRVKGLGHKKRQFPHISNLLPLKGRRGRTL